MEGAVSQAEQGEFMTRGAAPDELSGEHEEEEEEGPLPPPLARVRRRRGRVLREAAIPDTFRGVYSLRFSRDGQLIAVGFGSGVIQMRNSDTGELRQTLRGFMEHAQPIMCVRFHTTRDVLFASGACGNVFTSQLNGEFRRFALESGNEVNSLDVNVTGETLVTGGKDASIRVYDADTAQLIMQLRKTLREQVEDDLAASFHAKRIYCVRFHPQSKDVFLSAGWDDCVKVWDLRTCDDGCVRSIAGPHVCGDAVDVREHTVLTGSWMVSGSLQLWDLKSGRLLDTVVPINRPALLDGEFLYSTQFFTGDPYGDIVVCGGSGLKTVELISIKDKKVIGSFRVMKPVQAVDCHGDMLVYAGVETFLRIGQFCLLEDSATSIHP